MYKTNNDGFLLTLSGKKPREGWGTPFAECSKGKKLGSD